MAIRLKQAGLHDFVVFERADEVGGVWRDNRYPGCACDVHSHLYSLSFAPNADWSRSFGGQEEIWAYLQRCADEFGIRPHLRLGHEVRAARWHEPTQRWQLETSRGNYSAAVLVAAAGALSTPFVPPLPGLEQFEGTTFHSATWDHNYDLRGRSVAVVGTGASAVQFVPAIQPLVGQLYLFQRTPPWIMPRGDRALSYRQRRIFGRFPWVRQLGRGLIYTLREAMVPAFRDPRLMRLLQRAAERHLAAMVPDPLLRRKLTPNYTLGCKRILSSDDYLPALTQPNVEVITERITAVRPHGLVAADGVERTVDAIIFGTGFHVTDQPIARQIWGRAGRSLAEHWAGSPTAHLGTSVAGYPNLFLLQGPGTGLGHTSVLYMIESQIEHIVGALGYMREHGLAAVEPRPEAQAAYVAALDRSMQGTVWTAGGCASWYLDETGRNSTLWPSFTWQFRRRVRHFNPGEYRLVMQQGSLAGEYRKDAKIVV